MAKQNNIQAMKNDKEKNTMSKEYEKRKDELARKWGDHYSRWEQLLWQIKTDDGTNVERFRQEQQHHLHEMERIAAEEKELARLEKEKH